jgi:FixJ family two-component response regulator
MPVDLPRSKMPSTKRRLNTGAAMQLSDTSPAGQPPYSLNVPVVYVVDGDSSVRNELESLIRSVGWQADSAASAEEFLSRQRVMAPTCLLVERNLPGLSGLELQMFVLDRVAMPVIFMSRRPELRFAVEAIKAGAFDFLTKPLDHRALLTVITAALEESSVALPHATRGIELKQRYESLSQREREVMGLVVQGLLNKQVASELGISEITVKAHRGKAMRKMRAKSVAELVNMASRCNGVRSSVMSV